MAKQKMIYISDEMFEELRKEENASALIVRLLMEHFASTNIKKMTPEQREEKIKILEIEIAAEKAVREVKNG